MLINFPHQHFITCTTVKIHSFNVPLHGLLCQFQLLEFTPLCYEQHKRFNIHGTVHQHFQCFDISRGIGDRVNNGERPGISTARLFLPYDQIMTFHLMWTVTWLFKRETVCGVEITKCVTWYTETLCILCLHFDVHSSLAQGCCYNVICI